MLHVHKSLKQRLLSGGAWSFSAKVSASFLTVALAAIVARILPPEDFGVFFLSYSIIVLLSFFARFGLDNFCVRHIGRELAERRYVAARDLVNIIILVVLFLSLTISCALYYFSDMIISNYLFGNSLDFNIKIYLIIWLPITAFQFLFSEIFRSYHNLKYASIFSGGTIFGGFLPSIIFGMIIVTAYVFDSAIYLEELLQILFTIMLILLVLEYKILRNVINAYCSLDGDASKANISVKEILLESYPFFISSFSFMLLVHADTIVLGFYQTESEVAVYNAATRIAKLVVIILMIVNEVIMPIIVELNKKGEKEKLEEVLRTTATMALIPSAIVVLCFALFGKELLGTVYGEYYETGASLLVIMGLGQLVSVWAGSTAVALNMLGHQKKTMQISLAASISAIVACIVVAPLYGAVAVAIVIAIAIALKDFIAMIYVYKLTELRTCAKIFIGVKDVKKLVAYIRS